MSSKIKVDTIENVAGSGNVSLGSGHNLVVPGNITGQGTAAITSNATVGGTLGVGSTNTPTSSSGGKLIAIETTADEHTNLVFNTANTARNGIIEGRRTGRSGSERFAQINIQNNSDNGEIRFYTAASGSDVSEKMKIDASGYVTQSKLPMFNVIGGGHTIAATGQTTITSSNGFNGLEYDPDSLFNATNGRFTAPVAGRYFFIFSIGIQFSSGYHYSYLFKNGANISGLNRNVPQSSQFQTVSIQAVLNLAAGDYITAERNNNNISGSVDGGMFSGFLLG